MKSFFRYSLVMSYLALSGCSNQEKTPPSRDAAFLSKYPLVENGGKAYRVIPHEDILMRTEVLPPPPPTLSGSSARIDLANRRAWLYKEGQLVQTAPICAGKSGHETPEGAFRIISKHRDWVSTIYHVPMPFFLRLNADSGKIGLHAGRIALEHSSHGCIRLPLESARSFFGGMKVGDRVIVSSTTSSSP